MHTSTVSVECRPACKAAQLSQSWPSQAGAWTDHKYLYQPAALEEQTATLRPEQAEDLMLNKGKKRKGPAIEPLDTVNESDGSSPTANGTLANGAAANGTVTNGMLPWLQTAAV